MKVVNQARMVNGGRGQCRNGVGVQNDGFGLQTHVHCWGNYLETCAPF